jgi:SAM-dependent methyltransferase
MILGQETVNTLSYPDFVGFIGQVNTPPGGGDTIAAWQRMADIGARSRVLDLACTTGFSSRSLAALSGCSGAGIDLSEQAVAEARREAGQAGLAERLDYRVGDAARLPWADRVFTHVVAGGCFGFIQRRDAALDECARVLGAGGRLCISCFSYVRVPPARVLDQVEQAIGYRPDPTHDEAFWDGFFARRFTRAAEQRGELGLADPASIALAVRSFIYEESAALRRADEGCRRECYDRLLRIRLVLNEHRWYQSLRLSTWAVA